MLGESPGAGGVTDALVFEAGQRLADVVERRAADLRGRVVDPDVDHGHFDAAPPQAVDRDLERASDDGGDERDGAAEGHAPPLVCQHAVDRGEGEHIGHRERFEDARHLSGRTGGRDANRRVVAGEGAVGEQPDGRAAVGPGRGQGGGDGDGALENVAVEALPGDRQGAHVERDDGDEVARRVVDAALHLAAARRRFPVDPLERIAGPVVADGLEPSGIVEDPLPPAALPVRAQLGQVELLERQHLGIDPEAQIGRVLALAAEDAEDVAGRQLALGEVVVAAGAQRDLVAPDQALVPTQGGGADDLADFRAADGGDAGEGGVGGLEQFGQHQAQAHGGQGKQLAVLEAQRELDRLADEGVGLGEGVAEDQPLKGPAGPGPGERAGDQDGAGDEGDHDLVDGDGDDHDEHGGEGPGAAQPGVGVLRREAAFRAIAKAIVRALEAFVALLLARLRFDLQRHAAAFEPERHLSAQPVRPACGAARPHAASIGAGTRDMTSSSSDSVVEERRRDSALSTSR